LFTGCREKEDVNKIIVLEQENAKLSEEIQNKTREMDIKDKQISELNKKLEDSINMSDLDILRKFLILDLLNQAEGNYDIGYEGDSWGTVGSGWVHHDYLLLFTNKILLKSDYLWMEQVSDERINELNAYIEEARKMGSYVKDKMIISVSFMNESLDPYLSNIDYKIKEIWYEIENDKLFMYVLSEDGSWFIYEVNDSWAKLHLGLLEAIIKARELYNIEMGDNYMFKTLKHI
jgi:hypothetical protein